ncbi:MAG: AAA family ATPase [Caulobacterales bacterium]
MRTLAVVARKGGSGKTTLSVHLAIAAHLRGLKAVLADADPSRSASDVLRARAGAGPMRMETAGPKLFALQVASARAGADLMVIDTPAGPEQDLGHAVVVADLTLLVVRPTFLDIACAVRTVEVARRLNRPAMLVLNQALCPRNGWEAPSVAKTLEAFRFTGLPVAKTILRSRTAYQIAVASGQSAEEQAGCAAAREFAALWSEVDVALWGASRQALRA